MDKLKVTYRKVEDLIPYARNARTHTIDQINRIASSIKEFGFTNPILVDGENGIIAGHGRLKAAKKLGLLEVPTIELSGMTENQKRAYILADNKLALDSGWDEETLKIELDDIKLESSELFNDLGLQDIEPPEDIAESALKEDISDLWHGEEDGYEENPAILQFRQEVYFKSSNKWDIPDLREDMLYDGTIDCTATKGLFVPEEGQTALYCFGVHGLQSIAKGNVIGFYVDDSRFEKVWDNAVAWINKFTMIEPKALCTPNFSFWMVEPLPYQIMAWYKTMWCGRYWQEAGFKVIPTLNWGNQKTWDFCFKGIPKGAPLVTCEFRCSEDRQERAMKIQGLLEAKRQIEFERIIIYGVESKVAPFYDVFNDNKINFSILPPWSEARKKEKV